MKDFIYNQLGSVNCLIEIKGLKGFHPTTLSEEESQKVIDSGVEIAAYVAPVKTLGQLQQEAVSAMESAIQKECRSGTGKLYFSNIESAAMYTSAIQEDAEIRARAEELMMWSFAIDTYALSVVFSIEQGGEVPTIESFIAGLPTI